MWKMIWCFIKGHDTVKVFQQDNGRSHFREYKCLRCDKDFNSQYDYGQ